MKTKIFIKKFFETRKHFEKRINKFFNSEIQVVNIDRSFNIPTYIVYYNENTK